MTENIFGAGTRQLFSENLVRAYKREPLFGSFVELSLIHVRFNSGDDPLERLLFHVWHLLVYRFKQQRFLRGCSCGARFSCSHAREWESSAEMRGISKACRRNDICVVPTAI